MTSRKVGHYYLLGFLLATISAVSTTPLVAPLSGAVTLIYVIFVAPFLLIAIILAYTGKSWSQSDMQTPWVFSAKTMGGWAKWWLILLFIAELFGIAPGLIALFIPLHILILWNLFNWSLLLISIYLVWQGSRIA